MSIMKIRTIAFVLASAAALSGCAVVPYSPHYDDNRVYQGYPPAVYYGPVVAPAVIWGSIHWHSHRHGGGWHRGWRR